MNKHKFENSPVNSNDPYLCIKCKICFCAKCLDLIEESQKSECLYSDDEWNEYLK